MSSMQDVVDGGKRAGPKQRASGYPELPRTDPRRWCVIYPIYLNKAKSIAEGRRVPAAVAVVRPGLQDILECFNALNLEFQAEPAKSYPRDLLSRGRIRVNIVNDRSGAPIQRRLATRKALLKTLCEMIPALPKRDARVQNEMAQEAAIIGLTLSLDGSVTGLTPTTTAHAKSQQSANEKAQTVTSPTQAAQNNAAQQTANPSAQTQSTNNKKKKKKR